MALSYFPSAAAARKFLDTVANNNIPYTIGMLEKVRTTLAELGETNFGKLNKKEVKRVLDDDALTPSQDPHLNTNKDSTFKSWKASAAACYFFGAFVSAAPGRVIEIRDNRCDQCIKAFGQRSHGKIHTECITLPGELWGGCTNCYYSSHKCRCSKSTWVKSAVHGKVARDEKEVKEEQTITQAQDLCPYLPEMAVDEEEAFLGFDYSASLNDSTPEDQYTHPTNVSTSRTRLEQALQVGQSNLKSPEEHERHVRMQSESAQEPQKAPAIRQYPAANLPNIGAASTVGVPAQPFTGHDISNPQPHFNETDDTSNYEGLEMSQVEARTVAIRRSLVNGHGEGPTFDPLGNFICTYKHREPRSDDECCFHFTPGFLYPAGWNAYVSEILQGRIISPPSEEEIWQLKWEWLRHREERVSEYERLHGEI